jgi:predicted ATP-grasp superfamily ATP-dependent carboligase
MTLTDERRAHVKRRLDAVVSLAETARDEGDLAAAKRALNAAWFAIHDATTAINEAEQATRREALQNVERAA